MSLLPALVLALGLQQAPEVAEVRIQPPEPTVEVDRARTLTAVALDSAGARIRGARARWFLVEGDAVRVDGDGRITGVRPGTAKVAAVVGREAGFVDVTVPALPAAEIEASLPGGALSVGTSAPLEIVAHDRLGQRVDDPQLAYESSNPGVAAVDATGRVFARAPGSATIRVASAASEASVQVTARAAGALEMELSPRDRSVRTGDVVRFRVTAREGGGEPRLLRPAWAVSGSGAQIEAEGPDGVFVAEAPGRYRVTAQVGEEEVRTVLVEVTAREHRSRLVEVGRGPISSHNSGDMWAFEGVDGRDYAYVGTYMHDWMKAWDVTDPSSPVLTDSVQVDARRINDVKIHPDRPLGLITREGASNRRNGIVLLDLSDPAHPTILSEYEETVTGGVHNVWIDGENDLVYACHNGTSDIHIIDISDPRSPRQVGRWGLDKENKTLHDVIVQDGYAYLSYWDDGLVILDVGAGSHGGTPVEPAYVSGISYPAGNTHVAWRHGDYVFVGDEIYPDEWSADRPIEARGYVHVIDVSDLERPREVARYEVPEAGAHNLWAEGDRLYIGYYQAGLRVVDISGELRGDLYAQGREIARLKTMDERTVVPNWPMTWGAQLFKGHLFSSDMNSGLWVTRLQEEGELVF